MRRKRSRSRCEWKRNVHSRSQECHGVASKSWRANQASSSPLSLAIQLERAVAIITQTYGTDAPVCYASRDKRRDFNANRRGGLLQCVIQLRRRSAAVSCYLVCPKGGWKTRGKRRTWSIAYFLSECSPRLRERDDTSTNVTSPWHLVLGVPELVTSKKKGKYKINKEINNNETEKKKWKKEAAKSRLRSATSSEEMYVPSFQVV